MVKRFTYNGERFMPYRKMTKWEREQPLSSLEGKLSRYANAEFEAYWDLDEFHKAAQSDADLYWWNGKLVMPGWDTVYILNGWL
jgi:hypothetical protein